MLWLNRQDFTGILYIECPLFAEKIATSFCVALRWHSSWMLQKFKSLIVNRLPSLLRISVDNWITFVPDFSRSLIRRPYLPIRDSLDPFHIPHLWNAKLTGSQLFKNIYIMLYVVFNLLIWFWERCIEIYFSTCAGSPPSIQIYILLSCIDMC